MADSFSGRYGYKRKSSDVVIYEDAPEALRVGLREILAEMGFERPTAQRRIICKALRRRPNRWFLGLPENEVLERIRNGGVAVVLLCQSATGSILDFVLPPSKVQELVHTLSKSAGQLKFNVKKVGNRYHLVIPGRSLLDVSEYKGKLSVLGK